MTRENYWTRRVSRRSALGTSGSLAIGVTGLIVAGCGGDDDGKNNNGGGGGANVEPTPTAVETAVARPGGILYTADTTQAAHFSPYHPSADPSYINNWRRDLGYYDRLWHLRDTKDAAEQFYMRLATSVEQVDETTVVVKIHDGVKFHDRAPVNGRVMTAEDIVADIEFLKHPPASGGAFIQSGKDLESVRAIDATTLEFKMFGPRAFFFEEVNPVVVPKEMLDENTLKNEVPLGTGPYIYKGHQQGSTEEVTRNPNYWVKDRPYMDGKKVTFIPDAAAGEAAFRDGQVDMIGFTDIKQRDSIKRALGDKLVTQDYPSTSGVAIILNIHREPFNDIRVREAIHRAINIDRIVNIVWFGDADAAWYFSDARSTRFPIGRDAVKQYVDYDPAKAKRLIQESGVDTSRTLELMAPVEVQTWVDSAKLMAEDLQAIGLKVNVTPIVRNVYLQKAGPKPGDFDMAMSVFLDYIYMQTDSGTFWNNASLEDPEVDALVTKIREQVDPTKRETLSHEVETMLAKKYSNFVPVLSARGHSGWYSHVKGVDLRWSRTGLIGYQIDQWLDKKA